MIERKKIPKLRFGTFEQNKFVRFTDVCDLIHGFQFRKEHFVENGIPIVKIGSLISDKGINISSTDFVNHSLKLEKFRLYEGDVLMALTGGTLGKVSRVNKDYGVIYQNYRVGKFKSRDNSIEKYIYYVLQCVIVQKRVKSLVNEAAQPNFGKQDFDKIKFHIPSLPEQQKIADFLTAVDKRIELLEKKNILLETYKKGVMKKIFNQEIRFKDENGNSFPDWEEKRLGEVCKIQKGKQLNKSELIDTGQYPAINGGINPSGYTDEWNTVADTITISEGGNSCGYVNYIKTNFWCGGHCYSLLEIQNYLQKVYLFEYLKFRESSIMNLRVGSGLPNIQKREIDSFHILIPSINEQKTISSFLSTIGNQIELLETQIDKSKTWKKGLLQKMFV